MCCNGDTQLNPWVKLFVTDPNKYITDCDVLILSPVLQAGHSIEKHIMKQFCFFDTNVQSHADEVQMFERVRRTKRVLEHPVLYIEGGRAGRKQATFDRQLQHSSRYFDDHLVRSAYADYLCERADTYNRHFW